MKIGDRCFVHGYIDEIRKDTVIVRNDGGYFGTVPSEVITGELPSAQSDIAEKLYLCKCYVTDEEGLQHEVIHTGDIRRITGWEI